MLGQAQAGMGGKLAGVTTYGCPDQTWKNAGFLRGMQDKKVSPREEIGIFALHQDALCNSVLKINHIVDVVTSMANFRGKNTESQTVCCTFGGAKTERGVTDVHTAARWFSKGLQRVWDLRAEQQQHFV